MPGVSKTQRAEAKYNVVTEFAHLGLHSAAATGNVGLVKYALDHGQPINSVLDGVLPLHAACSGGSDIVVRLLIEKGADVNAPRLPRRYSSDKNYDSSAPIVGSSGSTPLHFACANGHTNIASTLLLHGAHADRPDKHGVTPEMVARQNGWVACADLLRQWSQNKDKDLREREASVVGNVGAEDRHPFCGASDCQACGQLSARLRVKRSIDNALTILRPSLSQSSSTLPAPESSTLGEPPSSKPHASYTLPISGTYDEFPHRRPSLPHVFGPQHGSSPSHYSHSHHTHSQSSDTHSPRGHSGTSSRRPRSAGADADPSPAPHKLRGKISLLSIFKKSISDNPGTPESLSGYTSSNSAMTSYSAPPAPDRAPGLSARSASHSRVSVSPDESPVDVIGRFRSRLGSESQSVRPPRATLHHAVSTDQLKARSNSGPGSSIGGDTWTGFPSSSQSPPVRPGILRPHHRSSSSTQSQVDSQSSWHALRFDSAPPHVSNQSRVSSRRRASRSPAGLRRSGSISSIFGERASRPLTPDRAGFGRGRGGYSPVPVLSAEPEHVLDDNIEDQSGGPVQSKSAIVDQKLRFKALDLGGPSIPPPPHPSSPLPSPDIRRSGTGLDYPFSINCPPDDSDPTPHADGLGAHDVEHRIRGDSVSSTSTTESANPPTSSSEASAYISTPALSISPLPGPRISTPGSGAATEYHEAFHKDQRDLAEPLYDMETPLAARGPRVPLDIDIRSISSHAQAEALVQLAQKSILEMDLGSDLPSSGGVLGSERSPLSARLAAYGESLALERKFKREEKEKARPLSTSRSVDRTFEVMQKPHLEEATGSVMGLDRKFSLEERPHRSRSDRTRKAERPSTSDGTPSSDILLSTSDTSRSPGHHQSPPLQITLTTSPSESSLLMSDRAASMMPPKKTHLDAMSESRPNSRPRVRSRTPDPVYGGIDLSAPYPLETIPLSRVSTAPETDIMPNMSNQERQVARANKLSKMGFSSHDWQHPTSGYSRTQASHKHRFGGIKTFVQSLKTKS